MNAISTTQAHVAQGIDAIKVILGTAEGDPSPAMVALLVEKVAILSNDVDCLREMVGAGQ